MPQPMTMTEKIIAVHTSKAEVSAGDFVYADVDMCLGSDITFPLAAMELEKFQINRVFNKDKIALIPDHFVPNKDIKSAEQAKMMREFAEAHQITNYFEVGRVGIEHVLLPEQGLVLPGDLVIGADSHTCTYGALGAFSTGVGSTDLAAVIATGKIWLKVPESMKFVYTGKPGKWVSGKDLILYTIGKIGVDGALYKAMEFTGETISQLTIFERLTMANMAIEAGAKNGIFAIDNVTLEYVKPRAKRPFKEYASDPDCRYCKTIEIDVSPIEPQVALPSLPENARSVRDIGKIRIDQVVIGSCTNGHYSDLAIAASVLKGKKVNPKVRCLVFPATPEIYKKALKTGLFEIFAEADCLISPPTCGPCLGGHMGVLAKGERAIATTNRNFVGRMGHPQSEVYLSGPAVAAASAITGFITHPDDVS